MRWVALALPLAACQGAGWTEERALAPFLLALDRDHSGAVGAADWDAVAWAAPPFTVVDRDGDGRLGTAELAAQLRSQDPMSFDAELIGDIPPRVGRRGPKRVPARSAAGRSLLDLSAFLADEVRAAGFAGELPGDGEVWAAVAAGDAADPEVWALWRRYAEAWAAVGLRFPGGLLAAAPAAGSGAPTP
ncbi:MAG: hypothetical protein ABIO70_21390 [Pseudomonadota bacterium]